MKRSSVFPQGALTMSPLRGLHLVGASLRRHLRTRRRRVESVSDEYLRATDAVAEIGEDRGGLAGEGLHLRIEAGDERQELGDDVGVHVRGHLGAGGLGDKVEEHVLAEVDETRVVVLEATVALVVFALGGGHGLDVGDERTVPGALPAEAEGAVEADERLPGEGVLELLPRGGQAGAVRGADELGGVFAEHLLDGILGEELRGLDDDRVGPVGRLRGVGQAAEAAQAAEAGAAHRGELLVEQAREGQAGGTDGCGYGRGWIGGNGAEGVFEGVAEAVAVSVKVDSADGVFSGGEPLALPV